MVKGTETGALAFLCAVGFFREIKQLIKMSPTVGSIPQTGRIPLMNLHVWRNSRLGQFSDVTSEFKQQLCQSPVT